MKVKLIVVAVAETADSGVRYREDFEVEMEVLARKGEYIAAGFLYEVHEVLHASPGSIGARYPMLLVKEVRKHRLIPEGLPEHLRRLFP